MTIRWWAEPSAPTSYKRWLLLLVIVLALFWIAIVGGHRNNTLSQTASTTTIQDAYNALKISTGLPEAVRIGNAIRIIRPLAEQGDAKAQSFLAYLLESGGNRTQAMEWYHRAAEQGDPSGELYAGYDYRDRHDYIRAIANGY